MEAMHFQAGLIIMIFGASNPQRGLQIAACKPLIFGYLLVSLTPATIFTEEWKAICRRFDCTRLWHKTNGWDLNDFSLTHG